MADRATGSGTGWWTVSVLSATMLAAFLDRHMLVLLMTPIKRSIGLSDTQVSLLVGAVFSTLYLLAGIPLARIVDRGNRKRILAGSVALWSMATAAFGMAQTFAALLAARMAQGIGSSFNAPATFSMVGDLFARDRLARPIAAINIGGALGSALALLLGGLLLTWIGGVGDVSVPVVGPVESWRLVLLIAAIPGPLLVLLILATVREPARREAARPPARRVRGEAIRHLARFRRAYLTIILATGLNSTLVLGLMILTPALLERRFGWAVGEPGFCLGAIILVVAPTGLIVGGRLADRLAARGDAAANMRVVVRAGCGMAPALMLYPLMPTAPLALAMLSIGLFFAMAGLAPAGAAIQRITPDHLRGTITAVYTSAVNLLGYGFGPLLVALATDVLFGLEARLSSSMALLAIVLAPAGLAINIIAVRPYRVAVLQSSIPVPETAKGTAAHLAH